ncbi:MAG: hypothetical protein ACRELB_21515 [Polyangiaceae bacterium]
MRRRAVGAAAASALAAVAVFAGCRGVLGIEPLELSDGGSDGSPGDATSADAPGEAGPAETGTGDASADADADAASDAGPPGDAENPIFAACAAEGGQCRPCCKSSFMQANGLLVQTMIATGCICGSGVCGQECDGSTCTAGGPPPPSCAMCTDQAILPPVPPPSGSCGQAVNDCLAEAGCAPAIQCLQACPPP